MTPVERIKKALGRDLITVDGGWCGTRFSLEIVVDEYIWDDLLDLMLAHKMETLVHELRRVAYIEQGRDLAEK